jgi:hypothetical protein
MRDVLLEEIMKLLAVMLMSHAIVFTGCATDSSRLGGGAESHSYVGLFSESFVSISRESDGIRFVADPGSSSWGTSDEPFATNVVVATKGTFSWGPDTGYSHMRTGFTVVDIKKSGVRMAFSRGDQRGFFTVPFREDKKTGQQTK